MLEAPGEKQETTESEDTWFERSQKARSARLGIVVEEGKKISQDDAISGRDIVTERGIPLETAKRRLDILKGIQEKSSIKSLVERSPNTAEFAEQDALSAGILGSDMDKVGDIESYASSGDLSKLLTEEYIQGVARRSATRKIATPAVVETGLPEEARQPIQAMHNIAGMVPYFPKTVKTPAQLEEGFYQEEVKRWHDIKNYVENKSDVGFTENIKRNARNSPFFLTPFVNQIPDATLYGKILNYSNIIDNDNIPKEQKREAVDFMVEYALLSAAEERRGKTLGANVSDILTSSVVFGSEFFLTAGASAIAEKVIVSGGKRAVEALIKRASRKALAYAAGTAVQSALAMSVATAGKAAQRLTPEGYLTIEGDKLAFEFKKGTGESAWIAFPKAFMDSWIEVSSERAGALLEFADKPIGKFIFKWWKGKNPSGEISEFGTWVKNAGVHGVLGEMGEEELAKIEKAALGIEEYKRTTAKEYLAQGIAFSVMPIMGVVTQKLSNPVFIKSLGDKVKGVGLSSKSPEVVEKIIGKSTDGTGSEFLYLNPVVAKEYLESKKDKDGNPINVDEFFEWVTGNSGEYSDALSSGRDIQIPIGKYATTIGVSEHNEFFSKEAKEHPAEINNRELKDSPEQPTPEKISELDESSVDVSSEISKRLQAEGNSREYSDSSARAYAEQHKIAENELYLLPLFEGAKTAEAAEGKAREYHDAINRVKESRKRDVMSALFNKARASRLAEYRKESNIVRLGVEDNLDKDVELLAVSSILYGKKPSGKELDPATPLLKINKSIAIIAYTRRRIDDIPENAFDKEGAGVSVDTAAEMLNLTSGDQLLALLGKYRDFRKERRTYVDYAVNKILSDKYSDVVHDPAAIHENIIKAMHGEARSKVMMKEIEYLASEEFAKLKGLALRISVPLPKLEDVVSSAKDDVRKKSIRNIIPSLWHRAEVRSAREALRLFYKGDYEAAITEKLKELHNHEAYKIAAKIKSEVQSGIEYLDKFNEKETRQKFGRAGAGFLEQIDTINERYSFVPSSLKEIDRKKSLSAFVKEQIKAGNPIAIPQEVIDEASKVNFRDLTYEEFKDVMDTVKSLHHMVTSVNQQKSSDKAELYEEAIAKMIEGIVSNSKGERPIDDETGLPQTSFLKWGESAVAIIRRVSMIVRMMDGYKDNGPVWNYMYRRLNSAAAKQFKMTEAFNKKLYVISKGMKFGVIRKFIPEIGKSFSTRGRLSIALNCRNDVNIDRLMVGNGFTRIQLQAVLDSLNERELKWVNDVGDLLEEFWPEISKLHQKYTGLIPEKVEGKSITCRNGILKGGYYPIEYNYRGLKNLPMESDESQRLDTSVEDEQESVDALDTLLKGSVIFKTTKHSHRHERTSSSRFPVNLSLNVLFRHSSDVIHDLTHYDVLVDMIRFLKDDRLSNTIKKYHGSVVLGEIKHLVRDVAENNNGAKDAIGSALDYLRIGKQISTMGFKITTAAQQPVGLIQSGVHTGWKWIFKGAIAYIGSPMKMYRVSKKINEMSDVMETRDFSFNREIFDARKKLSLRGKYLSTFQHLSMYFLIKMQRQIDKITFLGAYEKSLASIKPETASSREEMEEKNKLCVDIAAQNVLDSQGGGQIKDLSRFQRGSPFVKLLTVFYNFFNARFNVALEVVGRTKWKNPLSAAKGMVDLFQLYSLQATIAYLIVNFGKGALDDTEEWITDLIVDVLTDPINDIPVVRDMSSILKGYKSTGIYDSILKDLTSLGVSSVDAFENEETDERFYRSIGDFFGTALQLPSKQFDATIRGFVAYEEGEAPITSILFGPPPRRR